MFRNGSAGSLVLKVGVRQVQQKRRATLVRGLVGIQAGPSGGNSLDPHKQFPVVVVHASHCGGAFAEEMVGKRVGGSSGTAAGTAVCSPGVVSRGERVGDIECRAQGKGARSRTRDEEHVVRRGGILDTS